MKVIMPKSVMNSAPDVKASLAPIVSGKRTGDFRTREAFRALRSNIQFCGSELRTLVFTSCLPNEGKTHISYMTAIAFAELGKRVLFIDADLRKSVFKKKIHQTNKRTKGLSHFLSGQANLSEIICPDEEIENLSLIFTGPFPPNPAELLAGEMFKLGLRKLREDFDYIIIDAPPVGSVIDAAIVAKECDGAILVIAANAVSYRVAQSVKKQLEKTECKILGTVLNKVDSKEQGYCGKYYGKYYGDY